MDNLNNVSMEKPSLFNLYTQESKIELYKVIRQPGFTIPSLVFPIMFYLFFGVFFTTDTSMSSYMLATYGTFGVIGPGLFSFGVGIAVERGQGWFDLKEVMPMPVSASIFARLLVSMLFSLAIIILLFTTGALFADVALHSWQWLSILLMLLLGTIPFCLMGLTLGLCLSSNSAPAVINLIYLPMAFLSGLWIPISLFPEWLQGGAWLFPAYHLSQLVLSVIDMGQGHSPWIHCGYLLLFSVIFGLLAKRAFTRTV